MEWVKIFSTPEEAQSRIAENKPQLLIVRGKRIALVKHQNKFYATQDTCTHSGASLSQGQVNYLGEIICPLHNYQFNLQSGKESNERSRDLVTYPVKVDETGFYIGI